MNKTMFHAKRAVVMIAGILVCFFFLPFAVNAADPIIIDHNCADIWQIPESAIEQAKNNLHIAYGHTSHGSQLTSGMGSDSGASLDQFMTNNGATPELYLWNNGGSNGALDLHNYFVSGDLGNPDRYTWAQRTRDYLNNPANSDVNVIIWSWCGQASTTIANIDIYLNLMEGLINDYPNVNFVFMTGHLDGSGPSGNLNLANEHIRNHCLANNRILYDFADIESFDPDGGVNYMEHYANDNCDYDNDGDGSRESNWATAWQNSHVEGVDWWPSGAAHSQHLNGNLKGYAAWWLWATLGGWNTNPCVPAPSSLTAVANQEQTQITLNWTDNSQSVNETEFVVQKRENNGSWDNDYARVATDITQFVDSNISQGLTSYRVVAFLDGSEPCYSGPSNTVSVQIASVEPVAPSNLVSSFSESGVSLSWTDNSDNEDTFILERKIDDGGFSQLAQLSQDTANYLDNTVESFYTYTYRVKASNSYGESGYSNETSEYIPEQTLSITLKQDVDGYLGCTDTYLDSGNPDSNFGSTQYKSIGGTPQVSYAVKFELPEVLLGKVIHEAKLVVYCWSIQNYEEGNEFKLCELNESWDENIATWNIRQPGTAWSVPGGAYCLNPVSTVPISASSFYPEFDITAVVQKWSDQSGVNNGLLLVNDTATITGIKASEYSEYGRPRLEIQYSEGTDCNLDSDDDSDVDGLDMSVFVIDYNIYCLEPFANEYGMYNNP